MSKPPSDSQAARVAEARIRSLVRLAEISNLPLHRAEFGWDWTNQWSWQTWSSHDHPDRLVMLSIDVAGDLRWGRWVGDTKLCGGLVRRVSDGGRIAWRKQVDAVRDCLGWLRDGSGPEQDTGCEGAR